MTLVDVVVGGDDGILLLHFAAAADRVYATGLVPPTLATLDSIKTA